MSKSYAFLVLLTAIAQNVLAAEVVIEGAFGRAVIDTATPSVVAIVLRRADGTLEPKSLLSPRGLPWLRGVPDWGTEALTFAVDESGLRFESRNRIPESVHYNSAHEVRNAATAYSAAFATDSWPHMLLVQRFPEPIRLDDFERIDFTLDYQVVLLRQLSDWPARGSSVAGPDMNLQLYFLLREIEHPECAIWVGILLFASEPKHYVRHSALDQWGTVFYREPITTSRTIPRQRDVCHVRRKLKSLLHDAILSAAEIEPARQLSTRASDYRLVLFNVGWEGIGHWECEGELSALSLQGCATKRPTPGEAGNSGHEK